MRPVSISAKLAVNRYRVDSESHIRLRQERCETCQSRGCLYACPAECFKLVSGQVVFSYEGCLECGACRIACDRGGVDWNLPRPGFGISLEFG